jgi:hypothetical protein
MVKDSFLVFSSTQAAWPPRAFALGLPRYTGCCISEWFNLVEPSPLLHR